jgi:hypothetical protein
VKVGENLKATTARGDDRVIRFAPVETSFRKFDLIPADVDSNPRDARSFYLVHQIVGEISTGSMNVYAEKLRIGFLSCAPPEFERRRAVVLRVRWFNVLHGCSVGSIGTGDKKQVNPAQAPASEAPAPEATASEAPATGALASETLAPQVCALTQNADRPIDIVFSLDISTTMVPVSAAVLNSINDFTNSLRNKKLDVLLGGVAFVDNVEATLVPTDPENFRNTVAAWYNYSSPVYPANLKRAHSRNGTLQEGGQAGIEQSLALLHAHGRAGAIKMIFHISDVVGFAGSNLWDFSTTQLASTIREALPNPGELLFYTSASSREIQLNGVRTVAREQMEELRRNAGNLPGSELDFPPTGQVLSNSLPESISNHVKKVCMK